jgi:hypothetical protein
LRSASRHDGLEFMKLSPRQAEKCSPVSFWVWRQNQIRMNHAATRKSSPSRSETNPKRKSPQLEKNKSSKWKLPAVVMDSNGLKILRTCRRGIFKTDQMARWRIIRTRNWRAMNRMERENQFLFNYGAEGTLLKIVIEAITFSLVSRRWWNFPRLLYECVLAQGLEDENSFLLHKAFRFLSY